MSRRRTATVTVEGRVFVVTGWQVDRVLADSGLRPIYVGTVRGWMLDRHRLADALAVLQRHGIEAVVTEEGAA